MNRLRPVCQVVLLAGIVLLPVASAAGQGISAHARAFSANIVVPQSRSFALDRTRGIEITGVKVGVVIVEQAATTTMDIGLRNSSASRVEAELLVPVPEDAAVRGFTFSGAAKEPAAELLPKAAALETYKAIVAKVKDPALLEFAGCNLVRSSVFPVEARGTQTIRLTYEHLLPSDGDRVDYVLPRTESIDYQVPWEVAIKIKSKRPISTVYSPSHKADVQRGTPGEASVKITGEAMREPGPLQVSCLRQRGADVTASLLAYPDPKVGGGYFLLLAGLPARLASSGEGGGIKREITIVIDRSGSMAGEKIKQAKAAALQIVEGTEDGEALNVIDYSDSVSSFAPAPVIRNKKNVEEVRRYLRDLTAGGGTNLHDAILEALRPKPTEGMLPIVLFLTDGLPTVGTRDEVAIRTAAEKANVHQRRIFTFGVGYDVNVPLLSHLAQSSRAVSTFVLPNEDIEAKVSQVYRRLFGPALAGPELTLIDADGEPTTRRVKDLMPAKIPDLFEGDQLVVLGKYTGDEPLRFRLKGLFQGKPRTLKFEFPLEKATARNNFVPRLWAGRKIAMLVDEIRQSGAPDSLSPAAIRAAVSSYRSASSNVSSAMSDPKLKELVDEVVRLSVEFGVLTEYTAFLAREGTDLSQRDNVLREANQNLVTRAQQTRSGMGAVNQAFNVNAQIDARSQNRLNAYYDQNMNRVQVSRVQQVSDRGFFQQGNRWVDGNALNRSPTARPDTTVTLGSPEFSKLLDRLTAENRQGVFAMSGEILVHVDGKNVLIKAEQGGVGAFHGSGNSPGQRHACPRP